VGYEDDNYDIFTRKPENGKTTNISNNPDVAWTNSSVGNKKKLILVQNRQ
jgi:hypothetical protein